MSSEFIVFRHDVFEWFSFEGKLAFRQAATAARTEWSESLRERMFPPAIEAS